MPTRKGDGELDLGEIDPGVQAGHTRPDNDIHPWSNTAFDQREGPQEGVSR